MLTSCREAYRRTFAPFWVHPCVVMSLKRNNYHLWLTSDREPVFPEQPRLFKTPKRCKTATGKRLVEWKQSNRVINILLDVQAGTQKLYLQEGLSVKRLWYYSQHQNRSKDLKLSYFISVQQQQQKHVLHIRLREAWSKYLGSTGQENSILFDWEGKKQATQINSMQRDRPDISTVMCLGSCSMVEKIKGN